MIELIVSSLTEWRDVPVDASETRPFSIGCGPEAPPLLYIDRTTPFLGSDADMQLNFLGFLITTSFPYIIIYD